MDILLPYHGKYVSAQSADSNIDINEILNGCKAVELEVDNLKYCLREIEIAREMLNNRALSINGEAIIEQELEEYSLELAKIQEIIISVLEQIKNNAINQYNGIQDGYNNEAIRIDRESEAING